MVKPQQPQMSLVATSRAVHCVLVCLVLGAQGAQVTPMEKVITLLKSLSAKVTAEGAKEAAQYDKYACFCKEQATEKQYSIDNSDDKLANFKAQIEELTTANTELNSEISGLSQKISCCTGRGIEIQCDIDINDKTRTRNIQHEAYFYDAKEMSEAIDACGAAIEALKSSKSSMKGAKVSGKFVQVQKATNTLLSAVAQKPLLSVAPATLAMLSELNGANGAPKFQYQSNEIIATIETLQATFKSMKEQLDIQEADQNSMFEALKAGLDREAFFLDKKKSEKEAIVESNNEQLNGAMSDRDAEALDRAADKTFLAELTADCNEKALLFDQRSKMRGDEISVLAEATTELQKGAGFGASKALVGLSLKVKAHEKLADVAVKSVVKKATIRPVSFLQVNSKEQEEVAGRQLAVEKVISFLTGAAARTGSTVLAGAVTHAKLSEDHFVKVRGLIKDLLTKLKADADSESTQKGICDSGMKKAISDRDESMAKIEMANAKITTYTANQNTLEDDIETLHKGIAELKKGVYEATENNAEEQAALERVENMSGEAIASVKMALNLLKKFYSNALLQTNKYVPPGADRDGNTLDSTAPEVFERDYHASQQESKGIMGILNIIVTDFERVKAKALADEAYVKAAFIKLKNPLTGDIGLKEKEIKRKTAKVSDTKADIIFQQQALADAQDILADGLGVLDSLKAMCVAGEETWAERKKHREDEIQALKDAMDILANWQSTA